MGLVVSYHVYGVPRPQGSKSAAVVKTKSGRMRAVMRESCTRLKDWRALVSHEAAHVMERDGVQMVARGVPVVLDLVFWMARPKSHYRTGRHAGVLRDDAPTWHTSKPDLSKLVRAVEDSMSGIVYHDDAQIVDRTARKRYAERPGVQVIVRT